MDSEEEEIPIAGPPDLPEKFKQFLQQTTSQTPKIPGKFLLETLPYNPLTIDVQNRTPWLKRLFTSAFSPNKSPYQRSFLLYLPEKLTENMQIVVLLHGTNETILDTQLVCQMDGDTDQGKKKQKGKKYGWMEAANARGFVVVVPQSRGLKYRGKLYYGWQPGNQDTQYLLQILTNITHPRYWKEKNLPKFSITAKNISVVGFSNGGLFTSDLYISYLTQHLPQLPKFSILIFINYMGGIQHSLDSTQSLQLNNQQHKLTPFVIISCKRDENYGPCLRAKMLFQCHGCNVNFVEIGHHKHQFIYDAVKLIQEYMDTAREKQKEMKMGQK